VDDNKGGRKVTAKAPFCQTKQMQHKMSKFSRVLLLVSAILLGVSIFVPLWRIELDAPQYPEGLAMQIYTYKLGGDVAIINGLNHYIGMQTLHAENFIEFTILPYIVGFFALLFLLGAFKQSKKWLYVLFGLFVVFGIVAMVDFWRWEYNYGHNLDPNAAIIVPGMAYQPPLIGFKQLLNFGAYSIPDIGGWLFVVVGLLLLLAVALEAGWHKRFGRRAATSLPVWTLLSLMACNSTGPTPIELNKDKCGHCAMPIADAKLGAELITEKGRVYKFDDLVCLLQYKKANPQPKPQSLYVADYGSGTLTDATKAHYVLHTSIKSPMQGNMAAFANQQAAESLAAKLNGIVKVWDEIANR
jgi:copper chaperone NosL